MPEQNITPNPITETSNRFRHQYLLTAFLMAFLTVGLMLTLTLQHLAPLQRYYLGRYFWAGLTYQKALSVKVFEISDRGHVALALPADTDELGGHIVLSQQAAEQNRGPLYFTPRTFPTQYFYDLLRTYVYQSQSPGDILDDVAHARLGLGFILLLILGGRYGDWSHNRQRRIGIIRRGPKLLDRDAFNRRLKSNGTGFYVEGTPSLRELFLAPRWRRGILRIPHEIETSHILLVGATGTGKSQLLTQLMTEIQARGETAIVYDPDGEFLSEFHSEARGDIVLNPLDKRCPYWAPSTELASNEEALTLATSLFPDPSKPEEKNTFFTRAPRQILAWLFQKEPSPQRLVAWLASKSDIDDHIRGTEMEHMLSKSAGPQRSGILASLSMALNAFRLLPAKDECADRTWSALKWAETRKGWIFLTSKETTRDIQRPLISMWLDTLLLRLMTKAPDGKTPAPVWLIIDELASLNKLPTLQAALTRGRKYQIKTVLGFQAQSQLQEIYGKEGAETLLANPSTRIFFRTDDPGTADWVSRSLGDQEIAREKINHSHTGGLNSRNTKSYTIEVKTERAVLPSQISGLRNLHGYIRVYECIAAFTLRYVGRVARSEAFIPRNTLGFVPVADNDRYEYVDNATPVPGPESQQVTATRMVDTAVAGGGGGGASITVTPADLERDLPTFGQEGSASPLPPVVEHDAPSALAAVAEVALATRAMHATSEALHAVASPETTPAPTADTTVHTHNVRAHLEALLTPHEPGASHPTSALTTLQHTAVAIQATIAPGANLPPQLTHTMDEIQQTLQESEHHEQGNFMGI
jgi:type IV secretory pathway TraG/TraD family ATPase VirD4